MEVAEESLKRNAKFLVDTSKVQTIVTDASGVTLLIQKKPVKTTKT